jgi:hypothetical protein
VALIAVGLGTVWTRGSAASAIPLWLAPEASSPAGTGSDPDAAGVSSSERCH